MGLLGHSEQARSRRSTATKNGLLFRSFGGLTSDDVWEQARIRKMTYHRVDREIGTCAPDPSIVRAIAGVLEMPSSVVLAAIERRARVTGGVEGSLLALRQVRLYASVA
jgi:hypothetical protein